MTETHQASPARMQVGIFANTFKRSHVEDLMDAVQAHRIEHIEFNLSCLETAKLQGSDTLPSQAHLDDARLQHVRMLADQRGITMVSLAGYYNMIHPDPKKRQQGLRQLGVLMRAAKALNIKLVSLCTGTRDPEHMWRKHPANDDPQAYADSLAAMTEALKMAEAYEVMLAFEPEVNLVIDSPQKARRFLDDLSSARLKIIFDAANVFKKGELSQMRRVLIEAVELLADDIIMAHAKDLDEDGEAGHLPAGQGKLDYDHYLGLLRMVGFTGSILLHGLREDQIKQSLTHVNNSIQASLQGQ